MVSLWLATVGAVFLGGLVQGVLGFGSGLVAMSLLPFFMPVQLAVPIVVVLSVVISGSLLWQLRRDLVTRRLLPLVAGAAAGIPLGVTFLTHAPRWIILVSLGVVLIVYAGWSLRAAPARETGRLWGVGAGVFGGALGGAFATGGPPVVMWVARQPWSPAAMKAVLQAYFTLASAYQLVLLAASGLLSADVLIADAVATPAVIVGAIAGHRISSRLRGETFRRIFLGSLAVLGLVFIARGLTPG